MDVKEILLRKREGETLTSEALKFLLKGYLEGTVQDYHMSAWLMAVCLKGLSPAEMLTLTDFMWKSGMTLPRKDKKDFWIDKHSTGGVGDKTSLILVPLVTAVTEKILGRGQVKIPMISGRGLGYTGGTLDKLESVPGFRCRIPLEEALKAIDQNGFVMMGQTDEVAPLDKKMYSLRDATSTVESIPLIVASILSKKLSENLDGLVFDVKSGNGAFMNTYERAKDLAVQLTEVAKKAGVDAKAILTRMDEPLGFCSGNALEVKECADYLQGNVRESGMNEVVMELASEMVHLSSRRKISKEQAKAECEQVISEKNGMPIFEKMFSAQGGEWRNFEKKFESVRMTSPKVVFKSESTGWVSECHALLLGKLIHGLGGGRVSTTDTIDPWVGIEFMKKVGDPVQAGEVICEVTCNLNSDKEVVQKKLREAIKVVPQEVKKTSWIMETIG